MVARLLAVLLFTASLLATPFWLMAQPTHACLCGGLNSNVPSRAERLANAEIVAIGTVRTIRPVTTVEIERLDFPEYEVLIGIDQFVRGSGRPVVAAWDINSDCSGFDYQNMQQTYVLVLTRRDGKLRTTKCDGTIALERTDPSEIERRVASLREGLGSAANPIANTSAEGGDQAWPMVVAIASGSAALLALAIILWRGTRPA